MPQVKFNPINITIEVPIGSTILDAARQASLLLSAPCGGQGTCKACKVIIDGQTQLACKYIIQQDTIVDLPDDIANSQILMQNENPIALSTTSQLGLAVDIGTTTVVVELVDTISGQPIAAAGMHNPQAIYGADVISRIAHSSQPDGLNQLHKSIIDCLNRLIKQLTQSHNIDSTQIKAAAIAGNTTMQHLFLNAPVESLGYSPFTPHIKTAITIKARDLAIDIDPDADIYVNAPIAGYIGGDTLAVALVTDIINAQQNTLAIDIGTNGEILLAAKNKVYACSTAAGPALEGARITFGSSGMPGAIEKVRFDGEKLDLQVIGSTTPQTICGSGVIDLLACMLENDILSVSGKFNSMEKWPEKLQKNSFFYQNMPAFSIIKPVFFTQKDVRETQLAIAAIKAGITILCKQAGIAVGDIEKVLVAGAFGNYIDPKNAKKVGLLPEIELKNIEMIGNASLSGARMTLLDEGIRRQAQYWAHLIEYVELAVDPAFMDAYSEAMMFSTLK